MENECSENSRVIGGFEACDAQFPYLAVVNCNESDPDITGGSGGGWLCTGSFIFKEWVLTAGHCVHGCTSFDIYAGAHSRRAVGSDDTLVITVPSTGLDFEAPDYVPIGGLESLNDVALIPLPEDLDLTRGDNSINR